jgi:hypothetical protein
MMTEPYRAHAPVAHPDRTTLTAYPQIQVPAYATAMTHDPVDCFGIDASAYDRS